MRILLFSLLLLLISLACNNSSSEKEATVQEKTEAQTAPKQSIQNVETYPSLPLEIAQNLAQHCTFIDYLYYSLPISMSFNEKNGILTAIRHISDSPAPKLPNCKPIGRVTYQKDGEYMQEADIYFSKGCTFFIFLENNKPKYGNLMTEDAVRFYQDMIQRVTTQGNGG